MLRLLAFLVAVAAAAAGLSWLADRPGNIVLTWENYEIETSVFRAVVMFAIVVGVILMLWSLLRQLLMSPALVNRMIAGRRQKRGLEALSSGMIAIGAGDRSAATRYALLARKSLPNEPLTHLLRAQAAQLSGDKATARRIFEAMLASPDTEQLGLRGLFLEAQREREMEAAKQFAQRALTLNPKLPWPGDALFDLQCKDGDWAGAIDTLNLVRRSQQVSKLHSDRRRAVLLTAQAQKLEDSDPERALNLSLEAHGLAADLIPAAAIAARLLASRGNTPRAAKIVQKTWSRAPHPDLATVYAYVRLGDSSRDRLERVKQLATLTPNSIEGPIAVATAAIEARAYDDARGALASLVDGRLTQRACILMARIEGEQEGDRGRVREWLARALNAARDPAWTADGVVSDTWQPASPVTGVLDAFQWRVPVETLNKPEDNFLAQRIEELVSLGGAEPAIEAAAMAAPKPVHHHRFDVAAPAKPLTADVAPAEGDAERQAVMASDRTPVQGRAADAKQHTAPVPLDGNRVDHGNPDPIANSEFYDDEDDDEALEKANATARTAAEEIDTGTDVGGAKRHDARRSHNGSFVAPDDPGAQFDDMTSPLPGIRTK